MAGWRGDGKPPRPSGLCTLSSTSSIDRTSHAIASKLPSLIYIQSNKLCRFSIYYVVDDGGGKDYWEVVAFALRFQPSLIRRSRSFNLNGLTMNPVMPTFAARSATPSVASAVTARMVGGVILLV